mmetsp:Transcript_7800/g.13087  ORF Transcript_7800/g.13087 Transcript_7800/m.13087 type:complete len:111 (-) Transcript_7800:141-473(-)
MMAYDVENSIDAGIFFTVDQSTWMNDQSGGPKDKRCSVFQTMSLSGASDFALKFSIHKYLADQGFDYLLDNIIKLEFVKCVKLSGEHHLNKLQLRLKELRFGAGDEQQEV